MTQTSTPTPDEVLARPPFKGQLLIDGRWGGSADGRTLERKSPAHDKLVAVYAEAGVADAERAIAAARRAFDEGPWPRMKGAERARILRAVAEGILARRHELALMETLENGKPLAQSLSEIEGAADLWHYAATLARNLHGDSYNTLGETTLGVVLREPIGVVSVITPWNFPFLIVSQKLPFALAAGCTAVVKPAESRRDDGDAGRDPPRRRHARGRGEHRRRRGQRGRRCPRHAPDVDMLSFTGSTAIGKQAVAKSAATLKKVSMELGGKNPQIVFADCDWDAAVDAVVFGIYFNAGQCCNSGSRVLVEKSIADRFAAAVVERSRLVKLGDPLEAGIQVGAITTKSSSPRSSRTSIRRARPAPRSRSAARASTGPACSSSRPSSPASGPTWRSPREVFGPVLAILSLRGRRRGDRDRQLHALRPVRVGLELELQHLPDAARRIRAGTVWVNTFLEGHAELPFGGYRESGIGRELGRLATEDYTESKTLHMHVGGRTSWYVPK
jgi:betaine-aldehyde dehydrogenase